MKRLLLATFALAAVSCTQVGERSGTANNDRHERSGPAAGHTLNAPKSDAKAGDAKVAEAKHGEAAHKQYTPDQLQWKDGPPSLPPGAKFVVLEGDPAAEGYFALRLQLPDGYKIPAHWHPKMERVTVLSGTLHLGLGEKPDQGSAKALPAGSYAYMEPGMRHFAWTEGQTVLQLTTIGPWAVNYVNPADDPRNGK